MLSFGIETARARSIALARLILESGSGPPSLAATMMARESFEKSLPRLASAAPLLWLIDDHFEWPDIPAILRAGRLGRWRRLGPGGLSGRRLCGRLCRRGRRVGRAACDLE